MGFANQYFEKQKDFKFHIEAEPRKDLQYIIVIPCFYENRLLDSLESLYNCSRPDGSVEIIIVINSSLNDDNRIKEQNLKTFNEANDWIKSHSDNKLHYHIIYVPELPPKYAGAGLARKTGMDEAVWRFNLIKNSGGIIISFDADSICDNNYLAEIENYYNIYSFADGCSIYFEHPLSGDDFPDDIYSAITLYELHLRYYIQSLRYISFPFAYHTVGSCFSVKALTYIKQGGMNKKKAGEDFYFLHKVIPLGNYNDINSTRVIPSPRPSLRVPFGTGQAINKYIRTNEKQFMTYNPDLFEDLKEFFGLVPGLFKQKQADINIRIEKLPRPIKEFLQISNAGNKINEVNNNSGNINSFSRRLFNWFNAFTVIKYLNFCTENYYPRVNVISAVNALLSKLDLSPSEKTNEQKLLKLLRHHERNQNYTVANS
ncbi:MAG: hypothetical protein JSV22_02915 [Bacteroidales bacterium]|nr:MAG: hypothetical protein JSV22_02915 [Bacteroidales bacterium]